MKISVVVPVYNVTRQLLEPCLESLAMQTLRADEYEIIIVDDGSALCDTIDGVREFIERVPNARVVRHAENLGLNEARWTGAKNAQGDYVVFIDGDDPIVRDGLENLRLEAARADADMVTAPMLRWHPLTKTYSRIPTTDQGLPTDYIKRLQVILSGNGSFSMCGRLFRRQLLSEDVFSLPIGQIHEDVTTFPRIAFKAENVVHCAKPFYLYTLNFSSLTTQFSKKHPEGIIFGIQDWIKNAETCGILDQLSEAMSVGAEKLANVCVMERCFYSKNLSDADKAEVLGKFRDEFLGLALHPIDLATPSVRFLHAADAGIFEKDPARLIAELAEIFPSDPPSQLKPDQILKFGIGPSEMAQRLKDKVVIIGQVDYQVRNAAAFARELTSRGYTCVVLDNSGFVAGGKRPFPDDEEHIFQRTEHVRVEAGPYPVDWLSTAKLVVVFNDFNEDFREALEFRNWLELPSACAVEGISDFLRADFVGYHQLPYRRCDHVFLAGEHDRRYFTDRRTHVTGLPIIESLHKKPVRFPQEPMAVLNVNFTYGALEQERDGFVKKAKAAFETVGLRWDITQHPMDKGHLDGLPVSGKSQYQLIDEATVFVSRFATGILEALASGKPAIYFNPHHEKVEKFKEPLGAFDIATTEDELVRALRRATSDVEQGVNFRERAQKFLEHHTGYNPESPGSAARFAEAAAESISSHDEAQYEVSDLFFELAKRHGLYDAVEGSSGVIFGEFEERSKARLNEAEIVAQYFAQRGNVMAVIGGSYDQELDMFLGKGWEVHALGLDPVDQAELLEKWSDCDRLVLGTGPASGRTDVNHEGVEACYTDLVEYYALRGLKHVDFLKVDCAGGARLANGSFPWDLDKPDVILAEISDTKSSALGYSTDDLLSVLIENGYSLYLSELVPSFGLRAGSHWRRMLSYSPGFDLSGASGQVVGFYKDPGGENVARLTRQALKFDAKPESFDVNGAIGPEDWSNESMDLILLELDRLWVLSLVQERSLKRSLFSRKKLPTVGPSTSLSDLVRIAQECRIALSIPRTFDEERYRYNYPDVAQAIESGEFASGYEHYVLHGHAEDGRERATAYF